LGNAAAIWLAADPHAAAYRALLGRRATDIVGRLGWARPAHLDPRCLACHVTPGLTDDSADERLRLEGVGCEACHAATGRSAGGWITRHTRGWVADGLADCYAEHGMNWLGSSRERAAACVGCHVGAAADKSMPRRDVTHDLIAAGHPRLNFDYATFLAGLPRHWRERTRRPDGSDVPTEPAAAGWVVGRVETARAAADLLADRAARAPRGDPWPEFAGYDCFACHHPIGAPADWRSGRRGSVGSRVVGRPVWNRAEVPLVLAGPLSTDPGYGAVAAGLAAAMARPSPDPGVVGPRAADLARKLAKAPDHAPFSGGVSAATLLGWVDEAGPVLHTVDWDDLARAYYALLAVSRDRGSPPDAALVHKRAAVADRLRLPRGPRVDSPPGFHPDGPARLLADWVADLRQP
jgi:hypothetical protein